MLHKFAYPMGSGGIIMFPFKNTAALLRYVFPFGTILLEGSDVPNVITMVTFVVAGEWSSDR